MAKILGEAMEVVTRTKRQLKTVKCDCCGCEFNAGDGSTELGLYPVYFEVETGHTAWGTDSGDSIEHKDICPWCIGKFTEEYCQKENYDGAYMNIERKELYPNEYIYE